MRLPNKVTGAIMAIEVLVVEDDMFCQRIYKTIFDARNINATIIDNLESAVKAATEKKYNLYITDGDYPLNPADAKEGFAEKGACFAFYKKIKEINPDAKIVLISGNEYDLSKKNVPDMKYLSKPIPTESIDELLKSIEVQHET